MFDRYIGIDWSGAIRERGRVAVALQHRADEAPQLIKGPWARSSAIEWLIRELSPDNRNGTAFVGLDFCFAYPTGAALKVFGASNWPELTRAIGQLLKDNGSARTAAEAINAKFGGNGPFRLSHDDRRFEFYLREDISRFRLTELYAPGALSAWDAIAGPQVALSTLSGIAALAGMIGARTEGRAAFKVFPFEDVAPGENVLAEVYPGLAPRYDYPKGDQGDALRITHWVRGVGMDGRLLRLPSSLRQSGDKWPALLREEGWIAGLAL